MKWTSPEVKCVHPTSSRREMCMSSVSNVIYHKFSHGAAFYTLNGKNFYVMLEFLIIIPIFTYYLLHKLRVFLHEIFNKLQKSSVFISFTVLVRSMAHNHTEIRYAKFHLIYVSHICSQHMLRSKENIWYAKNFCK